MPEKQKMTWTDLTDDQMATLTALYMKGESIAEKMAEYGMTSSVKTTERQCRDYRFYRQRMMIRTASNIVFPDTSPTLARYPVVDATDAIVIADIEIPDHSPKMLKLALLTAMKHGIKRLIIAGDMIATDQTALNDWVRVWKEEHEISYATAIDLTRAILTNYGFWFDDIQVITGNHDDRIQRKTGGEIYMEMLLHDTPAKFTRYPYMFMNMGDRHWTYICHPRSYSSNAASSLGIRLYNKTVAPDGSKCHVVLGHTHLAQSAVSPDGLREIHALGCMRDHAVYKDRTSTRMPEWKRVEVFWGCSRMKRRPVGRQRTVLQRVQWSTGAYSPNSLAAASS